MLSSIYCTAITTKSSFSAFGLLFTLSSSRRQLSKVVKVHMHCNLTPVHIISSRLQHFPYQRYQTNWQTILRVSNNCRLHVEIPATVGAQYFALHLYRLPPKTALRASLATHSLKPLLVFPAIQCLIVKVALPFLSTQLVSAPQRTE